MTKDVLTDTEAAKLFSGLSANLNDPDKISEMLSVETPKDTPADVPAKVEEEVKEEAAPEASQPPSQDAADAPETKTESPNDTDPNPVEELKALKARYEELEHRYKSDDGRVAAFQRKARELEAKLAALEQANKAKPATSEPASSELDPSEVEVEKELEALKRVDPALYKILVARDAALKKQIESLKATVSTELAPVRQTVTNFEREREKAVLKERIPNIEEVVASEEFNEYFEVAPAIVKHWLKSKSADDVVEGMKAYALYLQTSGKYSAQKVDAPASTPAASSPAAASPVVTERERKLATSVNVSKAPAAPVRKELTEEELFAEAYEQLHKVHRPI